MRSRFVAVLLTSLAALPLVATDVARAGEGERDSKRAWLGVELDKSAAGVVAKRVVRGSPAANAGMVDGDVILSIEGSSIAVTNDVIAKVALAGPGSTIKVKIKRGTTDKDVSAKLVAFPGVDGILKLEKVGTFAPTWTRTAAAGSATPQLDAASGSLPKDVSSLRGKVVLIDFWEASCGPCLLMAPQLSKWHGAYGAQGLEVVGVTTDDVKTATAAASKMKMSYAVGCDQNASLRKAYGVKAVPTLFLVDKKGVIRDVFIGYDAGQNTSIEKQLKALLAEPAPAGSGGAAAAKK